MTTNRDEKIEKVARLAGNAAKTVFDFLDMAGEAIEAELFPSQRTPTEEPQEEREDITDPRAEKLKLRCIPLGAPGTGSVTVAASYYGELYVNTGTNGAEYHVEIVPNQPGKVTKITH